MSAGKGEEIIIKAQGDDEEEAVKSLVDLVENKLSNY